MMGNTSLLTIPNRARFSQTLLSHSPRRCRRRSTNLVASRQIAGDILLMGLDGPSTDFE